MTSAYLLQFTDDDQWLAFTDHSEAARTFGDFPDSYTVRELRNDGTWSNVTARFRNDWLRDEREAIALEKDVQRTYYAGCM